MHEYVVAKLFTQMLFGDEPVTLIPFAVNGAFAVVEHWACTLIILVIDRSIIIKTLNVLFVDFICIYFLMIKFEIFKSKDIIKY